MKRNVFRVILFFVVSSVMALAGYGSGVQGETVSQPSGVMTIAGSAGGYGFADGAGTAARFSQPLGIATDGTNLYVTEMNNNTIRKIVISTGVVTTLAGAAGKSGSADGTGADARFNRPCGIATDGTNLYVADGSNYTIRKIVITTGVVTTFAGTAGAFGSADGPGAAARFNHPYGIATDGTNLYVTDSSTIRKIVIRTGEVTTLAGTIGASGFADGPGAAARFGPLSGIATDGTNLYVTDININKDLITIRKIVISTGVVATLAGLAGKYSSADGSYPYGIATDGTNLYVTGSFNHIIRKIVIRTGVVTWLAGTVSASGSADGTGADARFNHPYGIATDGTNLYVADKKNNAIRKIVIRTGEVTTLAGTAGASGSADGPGAAARFFVPQGIATDGDNLYVTERENHTIRKIVIRTGEVTTLAGTAGASGSAEGTGAAARFNDPLGIATDGNNLYVADTNNHAFRKIEISTGVVTTFADGTGAAFRFSSLSGIATDGTNLYVAEGSAIRKIVLSTGAVRTIAGTTEASGSADGTGAAARFGYPLGIATDGTNLYVADTKNNTIRKIVIRTGEVTTLAGTAGASGFADGTGAAARFGYPLGIATDGTNLYVADTNNHAIRKIVISTGVVTTLAGIAGKYGTVDGNLSEAVLYLPIGIAASSKGLPLYVTTGNHNVRKIY